MAADAPPGGTVVVHMQAPLHSGRGFASLDPAASSIRIFDDRGSETSRVATPGLDGPAGLHWLESDAGVVWWDLDRVLISAVPPNGPPRTAFEVQQPDAAGPPLAIEDVRVGEGGLLVVSQTCGRGVVRRRATFVHLDGARVVGTTDLSPWAGERLVAATALSDGRVVLAVNDLEDLEAASFQCKLSARSTHHSAPSSASKQCWYELKRSRFGASRFRVLRIHRPGRVEVQSEHGCPTRSCGVRNWGVGRETIVVDSGGELLRLRSRLDPGPLMSSAGGVWTRLGRGNARDSRGLHSLWVHERLLLYGERHRVTLHDLGGGQDRHWDTDAPIVSARFSERGDVLVVTSRRQIVLVDVAEMRAHEALELLDVPAVFDARYERVAFNDATLLPNGTLLFDVVGLTSARRFPSSKTLWVGRGREGCEGPETRTRFTDNLTVSELRRLAPRFPARG